MMEISVGGFHPTAQFVELLNCLLLITALSVLIAITNHASSKSDDSITIATNVQNEPGRLFPPSKPLEKITSPQMNGKLGKSHIASRQNFDSNYEIQPSMEAQQLFILHSPYLFSIIKTFLWLSQQIILIEIEYTVSCPTIQSLPISTFMKRMVPARGKATRWVVSVLCSIVNPVKRDQGEIGLAHNIFPNIFNAMVYSLFSKLSLFDQVNHTI